MKVNQLSKRMHFLSAYRSVYPLRMLREHLNPARDLQTFVVFSQLPSWVIIPLNNKNYNFLNFNWFKKLLFSTNSLAKLFLSFKSTNHIQSCSSNQPITTLVLIIIETVYRLLNKGFLQDE